MSSAVLGVATVAFVGTNIDNFLLTTAQYAAAKPNRVRRITIGQLLGFSVVLATSVAGAAILFELSAAWIGLLGLVPLALGIRGFVALARHETGHRHGWPVAGGVITAALIGVGSSGDNLAVYIPIFREADLLQGVVIVALFMVFDVVLCVVAHTTGRHPRTQVVLEHLGAWLTPILYCAIGALILVRAGTLQRWW